MALTPITITEGQEISVGLNGVIVSCASSRLFMLANDANIANIAYCFGDDITAVAHTDAQLAGAFCILKPGEGRIRNDMHITKIYLKVGTDTAVPQKVRIEVT